MNAFNNSPELKSRFIELLSLTREERQAIADIKTLPISINELAADDYERQVGVPRALASLLENYDMWHAKGPETKLMATFLNAIEPGRDLRNIVPAFLTLLLLSPGSVCTQAEPRISELAQQVIAGYVSVLVGKEWRALRRRIGEVRVAQSDPLQQALAALVEALAWDPATTQTIGADALYHEQLFRKLSVHHDINFTEADAEYEKDLMMRYLKQIKTIPPEEKKTFTTQFEEQEIAASPDLFTCFSQNKKRQSEQSAQQSQQHRDWLLSLI